MVKYKAGKNKFTGESDPLKAVRDEDAVQEVFKDIRYCFYKYFDGKSMCRYSKKKAMNEIFEATYPNLNPGGILLKTNN